MRLPGLSEEGLEAQTSQSPERGGEGRPDPLSLGDESLRSGLLDPRGEKIGEPNTWVWEKGLGSAMGSKGRRPGSAPSLHARPQTPT